MASRPLEAGCVASTDLLHGSCIGSAAPTTEHARQTYLAWRSLAVPPSSMQQADLSAPPVSAESTSPASQVRRSYHQERRDTGLTGTECRRSAKGACWRVCKDKTLIAELTRYLSLEKLEQQAFQSVSIHPGAPLKLPLLKCLLRRCLGIQHQHS